MELLKHFEESLKNFVTLTLKDNEWNVFVEKLPILYKDCYIPSEELENRMKTFSTTKENELSEILPSQGNIQSGDFGEILSYFLFKEKYKKRNVVGPKKWRWKQDKNVAAPYTDVILFSIKKVGKPSKDDLLISVESKMKATASSSYHPIENAIAGAEKDSTSRIANTLSWLRKKYKDESLKVNAPVTKLKDLVDSIERFIKSETEGEYSKQIKAVAFVDKIFFDDEIKKTVTIPAISGASFEVIVVPIKDLQKVYEKVFAEIPKL
ncbi:MAG: Hachiman antiphage defense system protein HamA [Spirosomataceae bacterium]